MDKIEEETTETRGSSALGLVIVVGFGLMFWLLVAALGYWLL